MHRGVAKQVSFVSVTGLFCISSNLLLNLVHRGVSIRNPHIGGTRGPIHVESFNRNMKTVRVLESKWDPNRKKLVRRYLRNRTSCYGPISHRRVGREARGGTGFHGVTWQGSETCPGSPPPSDMSR